MADPLKGFTQAVVSYASRLRSVSLKHAGVEPATEERSRREDHRSSLDLGAICQHHSRTAAGALKQLDRLAPKKLDAVVSPNQSNHTGLVEVPVDLGPARANRESFSGVEVLELNGCRIRCRGHSSAQSVDLTDKVALSLPPHGWIAGHPPYGARSQRN
jgi:hypothetical protein